MPSAAAIAILEFGRALHNEAQRTDRDPTRNQRAEEQLIQQLSVDDNPHLKPALLFHVSKQIDPLVLRILALVAYLEMCTQFRTAVSDIAIAVSDDDPSRVLEARQMITRLLFMKSLVLSAHSLETVELGRPMLALLSGGSNALPLAVTAAEVQNQWRKNAAAVAKRQAKEAPEILPTARQLATEINKTVIGLNDQVKTVACRLALHLRRSALIRAGNDPGSPNECLLLIGPSGCGKTLLAEQAGTISHLPFGSVSATDMSATAYIGLSVEDCIRPLITAAAGDIQKARFGCAFIDEIDKKATTPANWRDVGGACVQQEFLRLMEGTTFQVGGRRGGFEDQPLQFNSRGTLFVFAGAYSGLDRLLEKTGGDGLGFGGGMAGARRKSMLYEALEQYGMLAEWLNRLTAVVVFPEPTVEQLTDIATRSVIPMFNRLLATCPCEIQLDRPTIHLLAEAAKESRTYARGLKAVLAKLVEDIVYDQQTGAISIGSPEIRQAIAAAGLG